MKCKFCGCTDEKSCVGGCSWIEDNVCSNCVLYSKNIVGELKAYSEDPNVKEIVIEIIEKGGSYSRLKFINAKPNEKI